MPPRFSPEEMDRRWRAAGGLLDGSPQEALLVHGSAHGRDDIAWLTGFGPRHDCYLLIPGRGDPVLWVQLENHVPSAREIALVEEVRWGGTGPAGQVPQELGRRGLRRLALVGRPPYQAVDALRSEGIETEERTAAYRGLRLVKSGEELEWLARGAEYTDAGMAGLAQAARPGASEKDLAVAVEMAIHRLGGQPGIHFISATPGASPDSCVPRQNPIGRPVAAGDVVFAEISAAYGGYSGQVHRAFSVAAEPSELHRRLYDVALEAYRRLAEAARPGATSEDLLEVAEVIHRAGLTICDDLIHGYGMGYLPPVVRTRRTGGTRHPGRVLEEGMVIVIQPNVITDDMRAGVQVGAMGVVRERGFESLQTYPWEFARVGD